RAAERRGCLDGAPAETVLRSVAASEGIDFATALLYQHVVGSLAHGPLISQINALRERPDSHQGQVDALLAVAPGAFYHEYPHSGADGRLLRDEAARLGFDCHVIPCGSMAGVEANAERICDWLRSRQESRIVLASISKGSADIKMALARPDAPEVFRNVVAWISLCGILDGSPMVEWLLASRPRELAYRALFWWRGLRFDVFSDLRRRDGSTLAFPLTLPMHIRLLHVAGFPLRAHLSNALARRCHAHCEALGPNDGAVLLTDLLRLPGRIYPVWGADHYLRPSWELRSLAQALLRYLADELLLWQSTAASTEAR
ncbi:MAG: hypothetical protein ACREHD_34310, partial [Pirellulales bacterium]